MRSFSLNTFVLIALITLAGCAHAYYYSPEIEGSGAIHGKKGGIVYSIPATGRVELNLRVRSLGIHKIHDTQMVGMRMSFARPPAAESEAGEYIDPAEQVLRLEGGTDRKPAYVHSKTRKQSIVEFNGSSHEVIEFLYPLAKDSAGAKSIGSFFFQWKVHYGKGKTEQQTVRFDRYDAAPQQSAELFPEDSDYPYDVSPINVPGWEVIRDPFWWPFDPLWPSW